MNNCVIAFCIVIKGKLIRLEPSPEKDVAVTIPVILTLPEQVNAYPLETTIPWGKLVGLFGGLLDSIVSTLISEGMFFKVITF